MLKSQVNFLNESSNLRRLQFGALLAARLEPGRHSEIVAFKMFKVHL